MSAVHTPRPQRLLSVSRLRARTQRTWIVSPGLTGFVKRQLIPTIPALAAAGVSMEASPIAIAASIEAGATRPPKWLWAACSRSE
jgi:hypothetical protein